MGQVRHIRQDSFGALVEKAVCLVYSETNSEQIMTVCYKQHIQVQHVVDMLVPEMVLPRENWCACVGRAAEVENGGLAAVRAGKVGT